VRERAKRKRGEAGGEIKQERQRAELEGRDRGET
jgi:hypothetical protein